MMTERITMVTVPLLLAALAARAQSAYPRTFTDGKGHTITLTAKPTRIASTVLGVDENLVDLVEPSRIVAMTEIAKTMPDVSNIADRVPAGVTLIRGAEPVIAASPDLVLTATYTAAIADVLIARKLPVYQFSEWNSVDALFHNFEILGQLVGEEQKAQTVLQADRGTLAAARRKRWPKRVRAVYYSEGSIYAANTVPSQVIALAGLTDAASAFGLSGYVKASRALIRNLRPDVVLFGEDTDEEEKKTAALFKTAEYQSIPAVKASKVYAIPGKHITTTSHLIVKAVVDVQNLVAAGFR
jgi:iron complex transport system substrate-binding protein